jgi:hypothetical protein
MMEFPIPQQNAIITQTLLSMATRNVRNLTKTPVIKFITCQHGSARQVVIGHVRFEGKAQNLCPA